MVLRADGGRPSCSALWVSDGRVLAVRLYLLAGMLSRQGPAIHGDREPRLGGVILEELETYVATVHCVWVSCVAYDDHGRLQGSRTPATSGQLSTGTKS